MTRQFVYRGGMDSTHARIPEPADDERGRLLADVTLWKLSHEQFLMALVKMTVPLTLVASAGVTAWTAWPGFSFAVFKGAFLGIGFFVALAALLPLVLKVDARGSTYCKVPVVRIERFEHELTLRDPAGALLGSRSQGTLRVARVNLKLSKGGLVGGLRLDPTTRSVWLMPQQSVGAWPGLRAEPPNMDIHRIDDPLFDDLSRLAE
ncbi:hypothetical protein D7Y13_06835 [Corallococcus praedator]|uniref:DUF304 domain-containing protein n=1 Tax=Corallococcus praedator TaxID=2316724 RepID=A0ABX9QMV1_9BACT|nr:MULTISPECIES: hypothetical protein [Corallococcus]RKH35825.1 hypothetical protein D7X75_02830 [Corallococcus sp. CA031C]RKI13987.1 hypothetical protein D7Y13_06835 [Corallococcus praedator]